MDLQPLVEKGDARELRRLMEEQDVGPLPDSYIVWEVPKPVIPKPPTPPPPPPPPPAPDPRPDTGGCAVVVCVSLQCG